MDDFLVKAKIVFDRGRNWVSYLMFLMMVFVTVTSMKEYSYFKFLGSRYWMIIVLAGSIVVILALGYIELRRSDIYQKEAEIYARINPVQKRIFDNQEKILEKLDEIEKRIA